VITETEETVNDHPVNGVAWVRKEPRPELTRVRLSRSGELFEKAYVGGRAKEGTSGCFLSPDLWNPLLQTSRVGTKRAAECASLQHSRGERSAQASADASQGR
jgi:hypothetical protein